MATQRILVVEDDPDIGRMLLAYFEAQGFDICLATRGQEALSLTRRWLPQIILLDIVLPDTDGYAVCRTLRGSTRTSQIPILFLTQKDERRDRIAGLELGADDYITKPFDIEELRLRVQNTLARAEREKLTDPVTGLPASGRIEIRLQECLTRRGWALLDCRLEHFDSFCSAYGAPAGDDVLRFAAEVIAGVIDESDHPENFLGHPGGDSFLILAPEARAGSLEARLRARLEEQLPARYSYLDRQRGYTIVRSQNGAESHAPLMAPSIAVLRSSEKTFADIRQITEAVAARRAPNG